MAGQYLNFDLIQAAGDAPPDGIVSRTIFDGDRVRAVVFSFAAGQELSEHTAAHPAIIEIVRGEAQLVIGAEALEGRPGVWVRMEARLPHSVRAVTPLTMLLLLEKG